MDEASKVDHDPLDPRIQVELEKLNSSTDVINKLECDLEEARLYFRKLLQDSTKNLNKLSKDIGPSHVEKSRCYYDARARARRAMSEAQIAASRYEKASSAHDAAKEMVTLAEEGFLEKGGQEFDQAWQEMLNHATNRVNESEKEKILSANEHLQKSKSYQMSEKRVQDLEKSLKKPIKKSRAYFELKAKYNQMLDDQKRQIQVIEETIQMTKVGYSDSLKELENISEEIHRRRENFSSLGARGEGVGSEFPDDDFKTTEMNERIKKPDLMKQSSQTGGESSKNAFLNRTISTTTSSSTSTTPIETPSYEQLNDADTDSSCSKTDYKVDSDESLATKMQFLKVEKPEDNPSDCESLASMDMLDDETIDKLMLDDATSTINDTQISYQSLDE